jgi:hypothetical protein
MRETHWVTLRVAGWVKRNTKTRNDEIPKGINPLGFQELTLSWFHNESLKAELHESLKA